MKQQIIALGGGGFSMEPDNLALDRYILEQSQQPNPAVAFLPTASGDAATYIVNFYTAFRNLDCRPSHLSLFTPHTTDIAEYIMAQDVIYVGGGNTRNMLAIWREWGLDVILRHALEAGVVLAGISAGANCWFQQAITDSTGELSVIDCLAFLPFGCSPHYDGEQDRRPALHRFVAAGQMGGSYAMDDSAALHFVDGQVFRGVASVAGVGAYWVERSAEGSVQESPLEMLTLKPFSP